mmetsp:Transcript_153645/g.271206  ORF Transcript_153645/g.271206 Transcript_153645/m.271206 type:complete len:187 (-) Transcript_153645:66-626(-)
MAGRWPLPKEKRNKLQDAWTRWAEKHRGFKATDIVKVMRQEGLAPTEEQRRSFERGVSGNSMVDREYFLNCCDETGFEDPSVEDLASCFRSFDPKATATVPLVLFKKIMTAQGDGLEDKELNQMLRDFEDHQRTKEAERIYYQVTLSPNQPEQQPKPYNTAAARLRKAQEEDSINYIDFAAWCLQR